MSPEAQRIAIAEACGWTNPTHPRTLAHAKETKLDTVCGEPISVDNEWWLSPNNYFGRINDYGSGRPIPGTDYLNDLNAMHEAEKVLNNAQLWEYHHRLHELKSFGGNNHWKTFRATAAQRAEAFLRTLNFWK